jgi:hypothetical protein
MTVGRPRIRRALCSLVATSITMWGLPAAAVDKAACVDAAETGQRLRKEGRLISARERLLICASTECPEVVSQDCTGWLGEVQRSLASVVVRARDANGQALSEVAVSLDGAMLTERAPTAAIELDPGDHVFRCDRAGFEPAQYHVRLAEGERGHEIVCELLSQAPKTELSAETPRRVEHTNSTTTTGPNLPWTVWALGGLGVAGVGSFAAFGLWGKSEENAAARPKAQGGCMPDCPQGQADGIRTKYIVADVSLAVGVVALGTALVIGFIRASTTSPPGSGSGQMNTSHTKWTTKRAQLDPGWQTPTRQLPPQHWMELVHVPASLGMHSTQVLPDPQYVPLQQSLDDVQTSPFCAQLNAHLRSALQERFEQHPLSQSAPGIPQQMVLPTPVQ